MKDCETFIRGTYRFKGFSYVISAFHDIGLTSDQPAPTNIKGLKSFAESLFKNKGNIGNELITQSISSVI